MSRRRRVVWALLATWVVMAGSALATLAWAFATEPGTRWALARLLTADVTVERVEGQFTGPLVLHGLDSRSDGSDVRVERLRLTWQPSLLRRRSVQIDELDLQGVTVRQKPVEPAEPEPFDLQDIEFPFGVRVQIDRLRVADLQIWADGADTPTQVDEVLASATAAGGEVRLTDLQIRAPTFRLSAVGDIVTRDRFPLNLQLAWSAQLPEQPPIAGEGRLRGELLGEMTLDHDLLEPTPARLSARITDPLRDLRWCAEVSIPRFAVRTVREDLDAYEADAEFSACGDAESMTGDGRFAALVQDIGEVTGTLRLAFGGQLLRLEDLTLHLPGAGRLAARGDVSIAGDAPEFRLRGEWTDLGWPLQGAAEYASPRGRFEVAGTQERYRLAVDAGVAGSAAPAGQWRVRGRGTPTELFLEDVLGTTLDGRSPAVAAWRGARTWRGRSRWAPTG